MIFSNTIPEHMDREQLLVLQAQLEISKKAGNKDLTVDQYVEGTFTGKREQKFRRADKLITAEIATFMAGLGLNWTTITQFPDRSSGNKSNTVLYSVQYDAPEGLSEVAGKKEFAIAYNTGGMFTIETVRVPGVGYLLSYDRKVRSDPVEVVKVMEDPRSINHYMGAFVGERVDPETVGAIIKIAAVNSRKTS